MKRNLGLFKKKNIPIKYILLGFFISNIFQASICAQERKLIYDVVRNGNIIGSVIFVELNKDQKRFLRLTSDVKTRFIFSFSDHSEEATTYEDGIMVYSSF